MRDFIECVSGSSSLYGLQPNKTLESLVLTILPSLGHKYKINNEPSPTDGSANVKDYLVQNLLQSLKQYSGFRIPPVSL